MDRKVVFKRPNIKRLNEKGFCFADMHIHTEYSDTTTKVKDIVKKVEKHKMGFAISDHNEIGGCIEAAKRINKDTIFIPGIEITTKELCHILIYFYNLTELKEYFTKNVRGNRYANPYMPITLTTEEIVERSKDYNCIVSCAHPCALPKRYSFVHKLKTNEINHKVLKNINAVEVICSHNLRKMNENAIKMCKNLEKSFTAGSDSHTLGSIGIAGTYSVASTREEFLNNIRNKKNYVVGKEITIPSRVFPLVKLANEHLKYFGPTMKFQYEFTMKSMANTNAKIKDGIQKFNEKRRLKKINGEKGLVSKQFLKIKDRFGKNR